MTTTEFDHQWMRAALEEAARGRGRVEPNPMVGAVVVARDGRLLALGHHERFGGPHAEVVALVRAGELARGATLYVTLEPCCHFGKTPPCVEAVLAAGIARVVAAMRDPFPQVNGGGLARLRQNGVAVDVGCEAEAARALNAPYLKRTITGKPFVLAKWAMTLDGKTATARGDSRWISGEAARRLVHETRGRVDAIIAGIGTVQADDPLLTARPEGPRRAARVVLDSAARLSLESRLVQTAREAPVIVAVTRRAPADRRAALERAGCEVFEPAGGQPANAPEGPTEGQAAGSSGQAGLVNVSALLAELGRRGMTNVLVEGGGRALGSFLDAEEIDAVDVFVAPILEGGEPVHVPARGRGQALMRNALRLPGARFQTIGDDVYIHAQVPRPWRIPAGPSVD